MSEEKFKEGIKKSQEFYDNVDPETKTFILLRQLLCNGTTDCENSPECPEGTDGCHVQNLIDEIKPVTNAKDTEIKELKKEKCKYCEEGNKPWWDMTWMHTIKGSNIDCEGDYPKPLMPNGGDFYDEIIELNSRIEVLEGVVKDALHRESCSKRGLGRCQECIDGIKRMEQALKPKGNTEVKP